MQANNSNFTKAKLYGLQPQAKAYFVEDSMTPHLRLAVYPGGIKTFVLCRKVKGRSQRIKIGRLSDLTIEQARKQAEKINAQIALGNDPLAEKKEYRNALTFCDLFNYYYEHHALLFTKRPRDNKMTIERSVFPEFGNIKACEITTDKIRKFHTKLAQLTTKGNANRVVSLISAVFNFCVSNSFYKGTNPCIGVKRYKKIDRDRFLNRKELELFFAAVKLEEELFEHFFLMLLYTGARKSNVLSMKWIDIDLDLKQWRLPETDTKNGYVSTIYLCDEAIQILKIRLLKTTSPYVFPGIGKQGFLNDPKKAFNRIKIYMGVSNFRMHDLRRTLASYMAIGGTSLSIIGKTLNHKSQVSTSIYARLSEEPVLNAINAAISNMKDKGHVGLFKTNIVDLITHNYGGLSFAAFLT